MVPQPRTSLLPVHDLPKRVALFGLSAFGLLLIFLFQKFNYLDFAASTLGWGDIHFSKQTSFAANRTIRFLLNDGLAILMIYAIFYQRKFVVVAVYVQLFGFLVLLPAYLTIKMYYPDYNGPLLSHLHRLTINPVLLMLLIPAFLYQKRLVSNGPE